MTDCVPEHLNEGVPVRSAIKSRTVQEKALQVGKQAESVVDLSWPMTPSMIHESWLVHRRRFSYGLKLTPVVGDCSLLEHKLSA